MSGRQRERETQEEGDAGKGDTASRRHGERKKHAERGRHRGGGDKLTGDTESEGYEGSGEDTGNGD
jgi:hypothetical protein